MLSYFVSASLVYIPACAFGVSIHKAWLCATAFAPLIQFATVCSHDRGAHLDVRGLRDEWGGYVSQQTAICPEALARSFSRCLAELFVPSRGALLSLLDALARMPAKDERASPRVARWGGRAVIPRLVCTTARDRQPAAGFAAQLHRVLAQQAGPPATGRLQNRMCTCGPFAFGS